MTKLNGDPIEEGDEFLIPSANLHLLLADQENYIYNKYIKYCITTGLLVASGGSSSWLMALEAGVIGTQMFLEHNEMNLNTMEDGDLKTSLIALKDYGDFIIVGAALSKYAFITGTRVPFISRTTNSGVVKHTIHNDEIGLVLKELRDKNQLSENLIRLKTLVNSFDNISDYKVKAVQKYLKAFEKDATFQQLSGNLTEHYVHFEALSGKPHFMYVPWGSGATIKAPHMFDVNFTNNQLELTNIDWLPDNTNGIIQSVAKYSNVKYTKKNGQLVSSGNIEVVRNSSEQFYMRIPPFDVLLASLQTKFTGHSNILTWLDEIQDMALLNKLDGIPNNKTATFGGDFSQSLKTAFNGNYDLIDAWSAINYLPVIIRTDAQYLKIISENDKLYDICTLYKNGQRTKFYNELLDIDEALVYHYSKYSSEARAIGGEFYEIYKSKLDIALEKLPPSLNHQGTSFGGYNFSEDLISEFTINNFVEFEDLLSTSKLQSIANDVLIVNNGNVLIEISSGYNGKLIDDLAAFPEQEVLFHSEAVFKVIGTPQYIPHPTKPGEDILYVILEQQ